MAKISNFMVAMIFSMGVFTIMSIFLGNMLSNYAIVVPSEYNKTWQRYQNTTAIDNYIETQKKGTLQEEGETKTIIDQAADILGLWFERGYKTLKAIPSILGLFEELVSAGLESISSILGIAYKPLQFMIIGSITVLIVIGILLSTLVKREV